MKLRWIHTTLNYKMEIQNLMTIKKAFLMVKMKKKKISWMMDKETLHHQIQNYKFKILRKKWVKAKLDWKLRSKMMIQCENITKKKQLYYNGLQIIQAKSGLTKIFLQTALNFMKIRLICLLGELYLRIYNGKDQMK